jgi:hypothetical protein
MFQTHRQLVGKDYYAFCNPTHLHFRAGWDRSLEFIWVRTVWRESATRIARLAFRVRTTGKVETDEWREAVASSLTRGRESLDLEASKLALRASGRDAASPAELNAFFVS